MKPKSFFNEPRSRLCLGSYRVQANPCTPLPELRLIRATTISAVTASGGIISICITDSIHLSNIQMGKSRRYIEI